jgi:hypothetical protein
MTTDQDPGTRIVLSWLREETHENAELVLLRALDDVDTTPQRRSWWPAWRTNRMNTYAKLIAAAAALVVVVVGGYQLLPRGSGPGGTNAPPPPSPSLIARGTFVEHDWGQVEFEATRSGSSVAGSMTVGEGRGPEWPLAVDLQCTRATEDGLVMIGGYITKGSEFAPEGIPAGIALRRGSPNRATVAVGSLVGVPATQATDCLAYLDGWLQYNRGWTDGREWILSFRTDGGRVEFGP